VTVVGRALASPPNLLGPATAALDAAGVRVHGRLLNAGRVGFLVQAGQAATAVRTLHAALIEPPA
jgi:aspartokinase